MQRSLTIQGVDMIDSKELLININVDGIRLDRRISREKNIVIITLNTYPEQWEHCFAS